jgi:hypothetical protein
MDELIKRIILRLDGIDKDDLTPAERQIGDICVEGSFAIWEENEDNETFLKIKR